jgi:3-deoxy-7-phosphoheptulonate synthase
MPLSKSPAAPSPTDIAPAPVENLRVRACSKLITPAQIKEQFPATSAHASTVLRARQEARAILRGEDSRLLTVVGPCSIHDPAAALEYASRLAALAGRVSGRLFIVMRVYFEKPRTTIGWKGLINDPGLDDSCDVARGIATARKLLLDITALGLPTATEFLDPIIPQYTADLVTWAAIGARTTESQTHREMASGLSMPVGFKNGTDGEIQVAIDAMRSACTPHSFLGIDEDGATSIVKTTGNTDVHLVLRGGRRSPNYSREDVARASEGARAAGLAPSLMVDCSHANSRKDPRRQPDVWRSILEQRAAGNHDLVGAMLESNLHFGAQDPNARPLAYGVSITDACMDWETTESLLCEAL